MNVLHVFSLAVTAESFYDGQLGWIGQEGGHAMHVACTDPERLEGFAKRNSVKVHYVGLRRGGLSAKDLVAVAQIIGVIRREKIDLVFGHTPKAALVAMLASRLAGIGDRVYVRHGLVYPVCKGIRRSAFRWAEMITAALATKVLCVSNSLAQYSTDDGLNSTEKQQVVGFGSCNGIDVDNSFCPRRVAPFLDSMRERLNLDVAGFVVGYCGRFCNDKGTPALIDGFRLFQSRHPELKSQLLLIGRFDYNDPMPREIEDEIRGGDGIVWPGYINRPEHLAVMYGLMDVFVMPTRREGLGVSILEASAMEVPVLATKIVGCVDALKEGETGFFIECIAQGVADGLEKYLDTGMRARHGAQGRKFVSENYGQRRLWQEMLNFYAEIEAEIKPK